MNKRTLWKRSVRDSSLSPEAKLLAFVLDSWMKPDGMVYRKPANLKFDTSLTQRQIRNAITELQDLGLVRFYPELPDQPFQIITSDE